MSTDPSSPLVLGGHVEQDDPVAEAVERKAGLSQFFLGDPQGWKGPQVRYPGGPEALKAAAAEAGVDLYVHAPYVINVATSNNRIRIPSRKLLAQHVEAAASIGAKGIVVHGGHVLKDDDPELGFDNWAKTFERMELPLPVLIENTAGGDGAMARRLDRLARLWERVTDRVDSDRIGFCLDTCHAHAGGEELAGIVDRVRSLLGRIDLVHANDSRDAFDSGADRHANLGSGTISGELVAEVVRAAGAPVVVETPGGAEGQAADIAFLRGQLDG
ncbi:deoxyribonuclease IV [Motilibacter rhizosphaerae]|nr:deoxyribonuclease IV [Motilibacter rhizosphaerae]